MCNWMRQTGTTGDMKKQTHEPVPISGLTEDSGCICGLVHLSVPEPELPPLILTIIGVRLRLDLRV